MTTRTEIHIQEICRRARQYRQQYERRMLSILSVWREELGRYAAFQYEAHILTGSVAKKTETLGALDSGRLQIVIVNYESAWRLETQLSAIAPDIIVADEGHIGF